MALSVLQGDPAVSGHLQDLSLTDWGALFYTSLFGSAISYGVFFYNATRGEHPFLESPCMMHVPFVTLLSSCFQGLPSGCLFEGYGGDLPLLSLSCMKLKKIACKSQRIILCKVC